MTDHPLIRALIACPVCEREKAIGLIVCWPCHNRLTAENGGGYGETEATLDRLESFLAEDGA